MGVAQGFGEDRTRPNPHWADRSAQLAFALDDLAALVGRWWYPWEGQCSILTAHGDDVVQPDLGIKDKKTGEPLHARWEGIADIEQLNGHLQAIFDIKPSLEIQYEFLKREKASGYALRIQVEKGSQVCSTADGTTYQRQGLNLFP
jgi:hypothetical protein